MLLSKLLLLLSKRDLLLLRGFPQLLRNVLLGPLNLAQSQEHGPLLLFRLPQIVRRNPTSAIWLLQATMRLRL